MAEDAQQNYEYNPKTEALQTTSPDAERLQG